MELGSSSVVKNETWFGFGTFSARNVDYLLSRWLLNLKYLKVKRQAADLNMAS